MKSKPIEKADYGIENQIVSENFVSVGSLKLEENESEEKETDNNKIKEIMEEWKKLNNNRPKTTMRCECGYSRSL